MSMKNFKKYFRQSIQTNYPQHSRILLENIEKEFASIHTDVDFAATSKNPIDRRLEFTAYFLALIKVLDLHGEAFEKIRLVSLEVVTEYVRPKNGVQRVLKRLPVKLLKTGLMQWLVKLLDRKFSVKGHPDGFRAKIITDKNETFGLGYGIDILECGICKLFKKHKYEQYAKILCEVDEITSGLAGLELVRTGTIANGAIKCDFRFKLAK